MAAQRAARRCVMVMPAGKSAHGEARVLIAAHEPAAMARVRAVFSDGLITAISEGIDPDELSVRGGLVSSHMIGLSFARFIFALDDAAAIPDRQLISIVGRTIHRYLTEPLTKPTAETTQDDTSSGSQPIQLHTRRKTSVVRTLVIAVSGPVSGTV